MPFHDNKHLLGCQQEGRAHSAVTIIVKKKKKNFNRKKIHTLTHTLQQHFTLMLQSGQLLEFQFGDTAGDFSLSPYCRS